MVRQNKKNYSKGFTLAELLVVMVILALLAAVSTPFIINYIRDARNGHAKSALVQIAEAYKTFKADYPNASISGAVTQETRGTCNESTITYSGENDANVLITCRYLRPMKWSSMKYSFTLGGSCEGKCSPTIASMTGADGGDYGADYCACVDGNGRIFDNKE